MDLGVFITFVLTIVFLIVGGIIQTMNKGKNKNIPPEVKGEPLNELDEIINQIKEKQIAKKKSELDNKNQIETKNQESEKKIIKKNDDDENEKEDEFDLKSAVVYDSILNRKKF